MRSLTRTVVIGISAAFLVGACSSAGASPAPTNGPTAAATAARSAAATAAPSAAATAAATTAPSAAPTAAPTVSATCQAASLTLKTAGKLTIGTDNPAFPPWFGGDPAKGSDWQVSDPASGKGYESAVAYAIAQKLGFTNEQVTWVAVPFNTAIQPGPKTFDILLNQVSWSAKRAEAVDLSDGYFENSQAIVSVKSNAIAKATSVADLKGYKLGAAIGTTSLGYINDTIKPTAKALVYNDNDAAIAALKAKQIDAIVADLSTGFYMTGAQLDDGVIVGSLPKVGAGEHFSVLMTKGSPLTACINEAIRLLSAEGTLDTIRKIWIDTQGNAPALAP